MLELAALVSIILIYIIPLNIALYDLSVYTATYLKDKLVFDKPIIIISFDFGVKIMYYLYGFLIFIAIYLVIKYIVFKVIKMKYKGSVYYNEILDNRQRGQKSIRLVSIIVTIIVISLNIERGFYDPKLMFLCILMIIYICGYVKIKSDEKPNTVVSNGKDFKIDKERPCLMIGSQKELNNEKSSEGQVS